MPQAKAHMGGNQVIGLNSSVIAESWGSAIESVLTLTHIGVKLNLHLLWFTPTALWEKRLNVLDALGLRLVVGHVDAKAAQLHVQALA